MNKCLQFCIGQRALNGQIWVFDTGEGTTLGGLIALGGNLLHASDRTFDSAGAQSSAAELAFAGSAFADHVDRRPRIVSSRTYKPKLKLTLSPEVTA